MSRDLLFNLLLLLADGLALAYVSRARRAGPWVLAACGVAAAGIACGIVLGHNLFHTLRLWSWATFLHAPICLCGAAILLRRRSLVLSLMCVAAVLGIAAVAVDAFLVEPTALEISRVTIETAKVTRPLRIVVVADLQTDRVGEYERRALSEALLARPDLILMPGDYVHAGRRQRNRIVADLRDLLVELKFEAPLGVYAVRGNVERRGWESLFVGVPVTVLARSGTRRVGEIALTGLDLRDSFKTQLAVQPAEGFHVVFGHAPDFALGEIDADLLIAGHTHGGQVRLPLVGPLITFSRVPRRWAAGVTQLASGATLVVSRGVGMERGYAPRLRFLCRPELVVIDVVPGRDGPRLGGAGMG